MGWIGAGRLAGIVLLSAGLSGCIDARVDVNVTSMSTAKAVMTQVMAPEFYAMVKTNAAQAEGGAPEEDEFCAAGELTENADGSATCVLAEAGAFATLTLGDSRQTITFTPAGPGLVRVALSLADMKSEIGVDDTMNEETQQMIEALFKDHAVTLHFAGLQVTETNMTLAADHKSAQQIIPFVGLIDGTTELPDEFYAVVRVQ